MNDFRSRILSSDDPAERLFKAKVSRDQRSASSAEDEKLSDVVIPREETRAADHRFEDRHRLPREAAITVRHGRRKHEVSLVNLSGGGAMIEAAFKPKLWDKVVLELAGKDPSGRIECAVRWLKHDRIGLEFAPETRIEADRATCEALLRDVLDRSFADVAPVPVQAPALAPDAVISAELPELVEARRDELRHPLVWHGQVHFDYDSHRVRLRNVSAHGALIESAKSFPVGAEIMLDLGAAGNVFARVSWCRGDQFGLAFTAPFDVTHLASATPQVAEAADAQEGSAWASHWGQMTLAQLRRSLTR